MSQQLQDVVANALERIANSILINGDARNTRDKAYELKRIADALRSTTKTVTVQLTDLP